ncbi:MAG: ATP-binding cassette domain-containing protein, partial [Candidatus Omnitrophica bacterium]|nr:ATP-binding cassette domain-containing protein [Candidatus Omnitrophota bacterium]
MPALMHMPHREAKKQAGEKAREILDTMGLGNRLKHRPNELSGGEAQRVAIGRALMNDPEILLCDEPTGNLDSDMGAQIYGILYGINKVRGTSVAIVTHHLHKLHQFDTMYFIKDGILGVFNKPSEVD